MAEHRRARGSSSRRGFGLLLAVALVGAAFGLSGTSSADVTAVRGSAFGYQASFTLFGGGPFVFGPAPVVTLPSGGSAQPISASIESAAAQQGPGILFTSGPQTVTTQGTTGPGGSVTSTAAIDGVPQSNVGEILYAGNIDATCTATETDPATGAKTQTGSVTITGPGDAGRTGATLRTSDGNPDIEGDETYFDIPLNPEPNLTVNGTLESVGDTYQVIFNEQVILPDGSLQVTAVHERLIGPTAIGDVYIGRVVCGVSTVPATTTTSPTTSSTTTTTRPTTTTTTTSTTTTTQPTTTTTRPTTTTTRPTTTTTTIPATTTTRPSTTTTSTSVPPGNTCGGRAATIVGTAGPDTLIGTDGPDVILGLGGDDRLVGVEGNDRVCAGDGNDIVDAGSGNDFVSGGAGRDRIVGGSGRDRLNGDAGNDDIAGGGGDDAINGGGGFDRCAGGSGTNTIVNCEV